MNIKILGTGCAKCNHVEQTAREVVKELGIDATIEEVKDIKKIMEYNVLITPGLVVNEEVVSSGRIPSKAEVTQFIINALEKGEKSSGDSGK
ncbi:MAG: thioredoxin family protein [Dehalococcoidia bacterium]|jgi:small redox-active disulfide protein 2|nr:thioredoxin family protein [Dehalococcoidia bacterium]